MWSPDRIVQGMQPDRAFVASGFAVADTGTTRRVWLGDLAYDLPVWRVTWDMAYGANFAGPAIAYEASGYSTSPALSGLLLDAVPFTAVISASISGGTDDPAGTSFTAASETPALVPYAAVVMAPGVIYKHPGVIDPVAGPTTLPSYKRVPFVAAADGSFVQHHYNALLEGLSGYIPGSASQRLFSAITPASTVDISSVTATRNAARILPGVDFACVSAFRQAAGGLATQQFPAVLLTPQHIIAAHVTTTAGEQFAWVRADGTVVVRTVVAAVGNSGEWTIAKLDSPVTGVQPALVCPVDVQDQFYAMRSGRALVPIVSFARRISSNPANDGGWLAVRDLAKLDAGGYWDLRSQVLAEWSWAVDVGDSNSPHFLLLDGKPVFFGQQLSYGSGTGIIGELEDSLGVRKTIEAWIDQLGNEGFSVQRSDMSAFLRYYP